MPDITFRVTGGTNVGLIRTNNEDNFIVNPDLTQSEWFIPADTSLPIEGSEHGLLMVVADGMGGMNAGEVASAIAIDTVKEEFSNQNLSKIITSNRKIETLLYDTIVKADSNIKAHVKKDPETEGMGTTIVIAWVIGSIVHVAWCGDSRAYLFNHKVGLSRLSKDHSYVQQLVDEGKLDDDLAFDHPNSNIITRSLGDSSSKARPDYMSKCLSDGDMIILCSDGLCGLCRDSEILELLNAGCEQNYSIEQFKNSLITAALEAGGFDNVTLTIMQADSVTQSDTPTAEEDDGTTLNDFKQASKRKTKSKGIYITLLSALLILAIVALAITQKSRLAAQWERVISHCKSNQEQLEAGSTEDIKPEESTDIEPTDAAASVAPEQDTTLTSTPPTEAQPKQGEVKSKAKPAEQKTTPTQSEAEPTEQKATPTQSEAEPAEKEAKPTEKEVKPTEKEAKPTEKEAKPTEKEAKPTQPQASEEVQGEKANQTTPTPSVAESTDTTEVAQPQAKAEEQSEKSNEKK